VIRRRQLEEAREHRRHLANRTSQLPLASRMLYRIEHYSSLSSVAVVIMVAVIAVVGIVGGLGFPGKAVAGFEVVSSAVTLMMVLVIQHTQGREQSATQRKLDELLRAMPEADEALMMLEEAPQHVLLNVESGHRDIRSEVDADTSELLSDCGAGRRPEP
jgi:low affinity Fe/Cu permease